ncbi:MAG: cupin domain-containing protein [Micromonosporaceae bacterium]
MKTFHADSAELMAANGIQIGRWEQYQGATADLPFDAMWCVIPAGSASARDCHPEGELQVFLNGSAVIESDGASVPVPRGGAVLLAGEEPHVIHNRSPETDLVVLSIYWLPQAQPEGQQGGSDDR